MLYVHESHLLLDSFGITRNPRLAINSSQTAQLKLALLNDAEKYLGNALLSLSAGLHSITNKNYGWAIVKLYYSAFYSSRALLAKNNYMMVYLGTKPHSLYLRPGEMLKRRGGQTHEAVLSLYSDVFPLDYFMSNQIEGKKPIHWMKDQRDISNYKNAIMVDPSPCKGLQNINEENLRQMISIYLGDDKGVYIFDSDHAMLAWPTKFAFHVLGQFIHNNAEDIKNIEQQTMSFIISSYKDKQGPIPCIYNSFYPKK